MLKTIQIKLDVIESLLYFWHATNSREKVGEKYLYTIVDREELKVLYKDGFSADSARKVLSALSNREILSHASKEERKFWNNNMWMMEDLEYTNQMVKPIKTLNLDDTITELQNPGFQYETVEIYFIPGLFDTYALAGNRLYINFFKILPPKNPGEEAQIDAQNLRDFVTSKLQELTRG